VLEREREHDNKTISRGDCLPFTAFKIALMLSYSGNDLHSIVSVTIVTNHYLRLTVATKASSLARSLKLSNVDLG